MADYQCVFSEKMGSTDVENQQIKLRHIEEKIHWKDVENFITLDDHEGLNRVINSKGIHQVWRPVDAPGDITPLHKASELGNILCLKSLIQACNAKGVSIDSPDCDGNTALFSAVKATQINSVKELLSANVQINARNDQGQCILHVIAFSISGTKDKEKQSKFVNCLDLLLSRPDIDLEAHNNSGFTPLLSASKKILSDDGTKRSNNLVLFCRNLYSKGASLDACDKRGISVRQHLEERSALTAVLMGEKRPSPQRPFISQFFDALLLGGDDEHISDLLNGQPQEEANRASNSYIGSQSVLFYVVDKCNSKAVETLLESGADPWKEQLNGELCLHRALSRGKPLVLNLLINSMKSKKKIRQLDFTYQSFELLEKILENQKKNSNVGGEIDHLKCLKRMMEDDIKINIDEKSDKGVTQSILHVAACFNNQEAIRLFIEKGAFVGSRRCVVGEDRGNILSAMKPETLERAMDGCITHNPNSDDIDENNSENIISPNYCLKLNYKFLVPPSDDKQNKYEEQNEVKTLMEISRNRTHRKAIKHPLIQTLLYAKWRKVLPLYIINLSLYLLFVIFLTLFMYNMKDLRIIEERASRTQGSNSTIENDVQNHRTTVNIFMGILVPLTLYMFVREIFQIIYTFRTYLKNFENYLEWFLIAVVVILCTVRLNVDATRHLAAWAMIIAWYEFVLLLGRAPPLAIYVTMLRHVSWNFLKLIFLFGALILAFTVSFNIILQPTTSTEESQFGNFWSTLPRAIVMATGEFEYSDLSSNFNHSSVLYATSAVLVFLLFLFLIFLVLMNVMNGLAVTDTQQVMEEATLYSLKSRLELIYLIEEMLLVSPYLQKVLRKIHLIIPPKNPFLFVKVNYPKKDKRILYGARNEEFCKLDNDSAHILKSYRLNLISEKEERERSNPVDECLSILQELRDIAAQNPRMLSPETLSPSSSRGRLS
ncbi:UNVERIFIED_CONTAM: hypothetical protein RMT77_012098 [Armadillidium vulgare]